jgi:hypothetical protein
MASKTRRRRRSEHRVARTWLSDHSFFWIRVRDREIESERERRVSGKTQREREGRAKPIEFSRGKGMKDV